MKPQSNKASEGELPTARTAHSSADAPARPPPHKQRTASAKANIGKMRDIKQNILKLMHKLDAEPQPPRTATAQQPTLSFSPAHQRKPFGEEILEQSGFHVLQRSYKQSAEKPKQTADAVQELHKTHKIDLEEQKITYQLKEMDLNQRLTRVQSRLNSLEKSSDFDDVLSTYDAQIS